MKYNELLRLCLSPLYQACMINTTSKTGTLDFNAFYQSTKDQLEHCVEELRHTTLTPQQCDMTLYALCAFIDESVMQSDWEHRSAWSTVLLQRDYFQESTAGVGFFKRLDELCSEPTTNKLIISLYLLCLQLGFTGKYRLQGNEALLTLRRTVSALAITDSTLLPDPLPVLEPRAPAWLPPYATGQLVLITASAIFLISAVFSVPFYLMEKHHLATVASHHQRALTKPSSQQGPLSWKHSHSA